MECFLQSHRLLFKILGGKFICPVAMARVKPPVKVSEYFLLGECHLMCGCNM